MCEAIDRLHTTAEAHNRVMVVEVMGRDAGWIALYSGIAGGADVILIPERPFDIDKVAESIRQRHERGTLFLDRRGRRRRKVFCRLPGTGAPILQDMGKDEFGHAKLGGVANILAREIEKANRLRNARRCPGTHPARWFAQRLRPGAGDALWPGRHRYGASRQNLAAWPLCGRTRSYPSR